MQAGIELLRRYVNLSSCSHEQQDAHALAQVLAADFEALGMQARLIPGQQFGPVVSARYGQGPRQLLLMGHYDTVFPRRLHQPFAIEGDLAHGSGVSDMKGGIAVMIRALAQALPGLDPAKASIQVLLNADEEVGSVESKAGILSAARQSIAALSFEPNKEGRLSIERKGVTNFELHCTGSGGHSGAFYKQGVSAIQALMMKLEALWQLRDDAQEISLNVGVIEGGTAENVIASSATARGEFRSYDPDIMLALEQQVEDICLAPGLPGSKSTVQFSARHPACKRSEQSLRLFEQAAAIAKAQGRLLALDRSGGAGDISFAAQAGIPVLDGLGLTGGKAHTDQEFARLGSMPMQIELAAQLIGALLG